MLLTPQQHLKCSFAIFFLSRFSSLSFAMTFLLLYFLFGFSEKILKSFKHKTLFSPGHFFSLIISRGLCFNVNISRTSSTLWRKGITSSGIQKAKRFLAFLLLIASNIFLSRYKFQCRIQLLNHTLCGRQQNIQSRDLFLMLRSKLKMLQNSFLLFPVETKKNLKNCVV